MLLVRLFSWFNINIMKTRLIKLVKAIVKFIRSLPRGASYAIKR